MIAEYVVKIVYGLLVGIIIVTGWVTKVQFTQSAHSANIEEHNSEIKNISANVNYIKGWVEAQPQPKRR